MHRIAFGETVFMCKNGKPGLGIYWDNYTTQDGAAPLATSAGNGGLLVFVIQPSTPHTATGVSHSSAGALTKVGATLTKASGEAVSMTTWLTQFPFSAGDVTVANIDPSSRVYAVVLGAGSAVGIGLNDHDTVANSDSVANPTAGLMDAYGLPCLTVVAGFSGHADPASLSGNAGWTVPHAAALGSGSTVLLYNVKNASDVADGGWVQSAEDALGKALVMFDAME